eukprot:TRINITY_DN5917_c0_g1_i3.p1 TRINITY_DN5917_c0_g1~~TRINITY_DN5917_c0_g1_i3.p1  ORF type:complete len:151 (-),score=26.07 TRINITY_DN5917_c0_g1_i3:52-504(-)
MDTEKTYEIEKVRFLIERKCGLNVSLNFQTPLHYAFTKDGDYPMKILEEFGGFDVNLINDYGETILHLACRHNQNLEVIKYLINNKKMDFNLRNTKGRTPFICALENKNAEIIKFFVDDLKCELNFEEYQDIIQTTFYISFVVIMIMLIF